MDVKGIRNSGRSALPKLCALTLLATMQLLGGCATKLTAGIFLDDSYRSRTEPRGPFRPIISDGLVITKRFEGFRSFPYNDAAKYCTVGYGHLIEYSPCSGNEPIEFRRGLSIIDASAVLDSDMRYAQSAVQSLTRVQLND